MLGAAIPCFVLDLTYLLKLEDIPADTPLCSCDVSAGIPYIFDHSHTRTYQREVVGDPTASISLP